MKKLVPIAVFLIAAALGLTIAWQTYQSGRDRGRARFETLANDVVDLVNERTDLHVSLLRSISAFLSTEDAYADRGPFARFVTSFDLDEHYRGADGYGLAPLLPAGQEAVAEARIEENYGIGRAVFPQTDQRWRAPVVILEPSDDTKRKALGYDMYSDPERRAAMQAAIESGEPTATGPVDLVGDAGARSSTGIVLYLPLYRGKPPQDAAGTREDVRGFVYAVYRVADLFDAALSHGSTASVAFTVWDQEIAPQNVVYTSENRPSSKFDDNYLVERAVTVGGRTWFFHLRPTDTFTPPSALPEALTMAAVSLLLAATLALLTRSQARRLEVVAALNAEIERNLEQKDLILQEMKHRIKNLLARVLAIARQTANSSEDLAAFNASFSARMQAMAKAQDLLTRAAWEQADLRELVLSELDQVFGDRLDESALAGPEVKLPERVTQALGLTIHELATNALKYGKVIDDGGGLEVRWSVTPGEPRMLEFQWREWGSTGLADDNKPGFGTRLIDANIRSELGGTVDRQFGEDGLRLALSIPLR